MFSVFLVCSGLAALVNVCVGYLLYGVMGFSSPALYALSVAAAFLSGMGVSFFLNRRYTFEPSGRSMRSEAPDFLLVSLGGLGLTTGLAVGFAASLPALFGQMTEQKAKTCPEDQGTPEQKQIHSHSEFLQR